MSTSEGALHPYGSHDDIEKVASQAELDRRFCKLKDLLRSTGSTISYAATNTTRWVNEHRILSSVIPLGGLLTLIIALPQRMGEEQGTKEGTAVVPLEVASQSASHPQTLSDGFDTYTSQPSNTAGATQSITITPTLAAQAHAGGWVSMVVELLQPIESTAPTLQAVVTAFKKDTGMDDASATRVLSLVMTDLEKEVEKIATDEVTATPIPPAATTLTTSYRG